MDATFQLIGIDPTQARVDAVSKRSAMRFSESASPTAPCGPPSPRTAPGARCTCSTTGTGVERPCRGIGRPRSVHGERAKAQAAASPTRIGRPAQRVGQGWQVVGVGCPHAVGREQLGMDHDPTVALGITSRCRMNACLSASRVGPPIDRQIAHARSVGLTWGRSGPTLWEYGMGRRCAQYKYRLVAMLWPRATPAGRSPHRPPPGSHRPRARPHGR